MTSSVIRPGCLICCLMLEMCGKRRAHRGRTPGIAQTYVYTPGGFPQGQTLCSKTQARLLSRALVMMHLVKVVFQFERCLANFAIFKIDAQVMPISQTGIAARRCASNALPYAASTCVEATTGTPSFRSRIFSQAGFLDPPPAVYTCAMNKGQLACLTYLP